VERLYVTRPLYPLATIAFSVLAFVGGLLIAKSVVFLPALAALCVLYACFGYGSVMLRCLAIFVPLGALLGGLSYLVFGEVAAIYETAGRIVLVGLCAVPLVSTPPVVLTRSLAAFHMPRVIVLGILVAIRFLPVLLREMRQVREAMKTRGVRTGRDPRSLYRAFVIPLVMRIINISEILSLSLETRAFDLNVEQVTIYHPVRFTMRDGIFSALGAALICGCAACAFLGIGASI
jgi:energy-coupling factor transport system permease protein